MSTLKNFTMNQIDVLSQLAHTKGVRDLARRNSMDPAGVSRLLSEVERVFGFKIATRSKTGLSLTEEGKQIVLMASELTLHLRKFEEIGSIDPEFSKIKTLNLASRGFLTTLLSGLLSRNSIPEQNFKLRFLDSSPQDTLRAALAGLVDVAVHIEKWSWPGTWLSQEAATLTWGLVARQDHPIKTKILIKDSQKYPFVGSSYLSSDRLERSTDVFPLKWSERRIGHESQTAFTSKAIVLGSDHLAFLPLVTVENELRNKEIKLIRVTDMQVIQMKLYLSVNQERVSQGAHKILGSALKELGRIDQHLGRNLQSPEAVKEASPLNRISL